MLPPPVRKRCWEIQQLLSLQKMRAIPHLVGKLFVFPLTEREIPIIADHHVDPEFGTGMVKITPAHDPNDYQMGLTHNLPFINIMTPDGNQ